MTSSISYVDYATESFDKLAEISKDPETKVFVTIFEMAINNLVTADEESGLTTLSTSKVKMNPVADNIVGLFTGFPGDVIGITGAVHTFYKEGFKFNTMHQYTQAITGASRVVASVGRYFDKADVVKYALYTSYYTDFAALANKIFFTPVYNKVNGIKA